MITKISLQCLQQTTYYNPAQIGEAHYMQDAFMQINYVATRLEKISYFAKYLDENRNTDGFDIERACMIWLGEKPLISQITKKKRIYIIQYLYIHETIN